MMRRAFWILACVIFLHPFRGFAAPAGEDLQKEEARRKLEEQFKSLSNSLGAMPRPPELNQAIQLPDAPLREDMPVHKEKDSR